MLWRCLWTKCLLLKATVKLQVNRNSYGLPAREMTGGYFCCACEFGMDMAKVGRQYLSTSRFLEGISKSLQVAFVSVRSISPCSSSECATLGAVFRMRWHRGDLLQFAVDGDLAGKMRATFHSFFRYARPLNGLEASDCGDLCDRRTVCGSVADAGQH